MKHILVTGGAGFIGAHLCEALLNRGDRVTCLDNFSTGSRNNIQHLQHLNVIEGDVNDPKTLVSLHNTHFDAVFHYAAVVGVKRTEEQSQQVLQDVQGFWHIAKLAQAGKVDKIIFASSSEVYGEPTHIPEEESEGIKGWSPYSTVKLYGEYLFSSLWREQGIPTVSLRFFNVYGPRQKGSSYGFVTARFIEQVLAGQAPTIFGDGSQTRDLVYIKDNIRAALVALDRSEANGQIINIGSGKKTRIIDLAETIISTVGGQTTLQPVFLPARLNEVKHRCASVKRMEELLGFSCTTSLVEGIKKTIATQAYNPVPVMAQQVSS